VELTGTEVALKDTAKKLGLGLALLLTVYPTASSNAVLKDSPKALVDQAWQTVQRNYVDRTFNRQDWIKVRSQYLQPAYTTKESAYQAIAAMLDSLGDPYTRFLTPDALKELTQNISGEFVGVGLTVSLDAKTREWVVEKAFDESPAAIAGLKPKDIIVSINGKSTPSIDPSKAAPYLIGPVGSKLTVQARRGQETLKHELVREPINLNPLTYKAVPNKSGTVGYIRLPIFTTKSINSMQNALKTLEFQKASGYLLDLRGNPGGVLDAGIAIARMWLAKGTIVSVQERNLPRQTVAATNQALTTRPLVVLVDQESASASEVLAAALQDNKRAVLVGKVTFGKGLVQSFEPLSDSSGVLVTIAKYFTPSGKNIHKIGITPDVEAAVTAQPPRDSQYEVGMKTLEQLLSRSPIKKSAQN
jgi:carboxyl-terminal processing protease